MLDHPGVKSSEVAQFFNVPESTVTEIFTNLTTVPIPESTEITSPNNYIDINWDALDFEGELEINSHPGLSRVPRLNHKEFAAIISGLQFLKYIASREEIPVIDVLLKKLKTGSANEHSSVLIQDAPISANIDSIRLALSEKKTLDITYVGYEGTVTSRTIEPIELFSADGRWYLQSWCRLRNAPRSFSIDQIQSVEINNEKFERRDFFNTWETSFTNTQAIYVQLEVDPVIIPFISDWNFKRVDAKVIEIPVYHFHSLKRLVTKFAGKLKVVSPPEAVKEVTKWSNDALNRYTK
ncbi:MAG: WYL domain-containing protein [Microbacteriaceae bacterium]|nr:WYL domain-containing protein [Microbacteriaceae bacterium]